MSSVTLADFKAHANVTDTQDDDELVELLDAAIEIVESIAGPIESLSSVTEVHRCLRGGELVLRRMPVGELMSISSRYGLTTTALSLGAYELDAETGIVRSVYGSGFYGDYTVTYTAGRDVLPAAIRLAVLVIAEQLLETQRRPGQTSDTPAGFGGLDGPDATSQVSMGFAIPSRALELLQPYMRPTIA